MTVLCRCLKIVQILMLQCQPGKDLGDISHEVLKVELGVD